MINRVKITMTLCACLLASNAYSDRLYKKGIYIKAASGLVLYEKLKKKGEFGVYEQKRGKTTAPIYLVLGYSHNKNVVTEVLARFSRFKYTTHRSSNKNSTDSQTMDSHSLFWNVYLKYPITKRIAPYVIIGPGISFNISKSIKIMSSINGLNKTSPGKSITSFAWNIGFGSEFYSSNKVLLDLGYRFASIGEIGIKANLGAPKESRKIKAHDITLGLTYKF
jgi:opacity protein-like surface antigen